MGTFIVNAKNYQKGYGESGLQIARKLDSVAYDLNGSSSRITAIFAPTTAHLAYYSQRRFEKVKIYCQGTNFALAEESTSAISSESVKLVAEGTFVGHSESHTSKSECAGLIKRAKSAGLETAVFVGVGNEARQIAAERPTYIILEKSGPESHIGPETIKDSIRAVRRVDPKIRVLVGSSINDAQDVRFVMKLGGEGVVVDRPVMTIQDPEALRAKLMELMQPIAEQQVGNKWQR